MSLYDLELDERDDLKRMGQLVGVKKKRWESDRAYRKRIQKAVDGVHGYGERKPRIWDIQFVWNPWLSIGLNIAFRELRIDFHLPFVIIYAGNMRYSGGARLSNYGLRRLFGFDVVNKSDTKTFHDNVKLEGTKPIHRWDVQFFWSHSFSVGIHIDHEDPHVMIILPLGHTSFGKNSAKHGSGGWWSSRDFIKRMVRIIFPPNYRGPRDVY